MGSRFHRQTEQRVTEALQALALRVCEAELLGTEEDVIAGQQQQQQEEQHEEEEQQRQHEQGAPWEREGRRQRQVYAQALARHTAPTAKRMLTNHPYLDVNEQYVQRRYKAVEEKIWINGHMQLSQQLQAAVQRFLAHSLDGVSREPTREHFTLLSLMLELANDPMACPYQPAAHKLRQSLPHDETAHLSPLHGLELYITGTRPLEEQPEVPALEEEMALSEPETQDQTEAGLGETGEEAVPSQAIARVEGLAAPEHLRTEPTPLHETLPTDAASFDTDIDLTVFSAFAHAAAQRRASANMALEHDGGYRQRVLVQAACGMLQGNRSVDIFVYDRDADEYRLPHTMPRMPRISTAATQRVLLHLLETGNAINGLRRLCLDPPRFDESPVASAVAAAANRIMGHWHAAVDAMSPRCQTLLALDTEVHKASRGILDLSRLVTDIRRRDWVGSLNALHRLASAWTHVRGPLHRQRLQHSSHSASATALLNAIPFVYAEACRPVLMSTHAWLLRGQAQACLPIRVTHTSGGPPSSTQSSSSRSPPVVEKTRAGNDDTRPSTTHRSSSSPSSSPSSSSFIAQSALSGHTSSTASPSPFAEISPPLARSPSALATSATAAMDGHSFWRSDVALSSAVPAILADCAEQLVEAGKSALLLLKLNDWHVLTKLSKHPDFKLLAALGTGISSQVPTQPASRSATAPSIRDGGVETDADSGYGGGDVGLIWRAVAMATAATTPELAHTKRANAEGSKAAPRVHSVWTFQQLLRRCILYAHRMTGTALLACLRERLQLNEHFEGLRAFFLMSKGDLSLEWLTIVTRHLSRGQNSSLCTLDLEDACTTYLPFLSGRLAVAFQERTNENALSGVHITYHIDPVLTMLVTPEHMREYNAVHQTMLLLKQARWTLEHLSFKRDFKMGGVSHGCMMVRSRLLYFVRVLDEYTMHRALDEPIQAFSVDMKRANSVEDVYRAHSKFVATVRRRVLLPGTLQLYVLNLLNAALKFGLICRAKQDRLSELQRAELDSYRAVKALVKVLESADARRFPHVSALAAQLSGGDQWRAKFQRVL